ncbi:MAG: cbb3-type cytochrome c oxidase subunit I [Rickettsiales bacterium]|nr:cbb3-type cytochrome c oxidase subunit I [Rickettsiales bacterium]
MHMSALELMMSGVSSLSWPKRWLWLAVMAIALAGIFSIVLVIARTPQLQGIPMIADLFHVSLVVHVDLSVLVWFLAMFCFYAAILRARTGPKELPLFNVTSWSCMAAGMLLIALSPLYPEWTTIKSNYIPVITNVFFFFGVALVFCSVMIECIHTIWVRPLKGSAFIDKGIYGAVITSLMALAAFIATPLLLDVPLEGLAKYEVMFWAGGHVLQFTYVQIMMVSWCLMALLLGYVLPRSSTMLAIFAIGPVITLSSIYPFVVFDIHSQEFMDFFTQQMIVGGGVASAVLCAFLVWRSIRASVSEPNMRAVRGCFIMSILLFLFGGAFGLAIDGPNVRIPAHYHGSIVAVTLALMGIAYAILPAFGFEAVAEKRLAIWQPYLYGVGQLMHISGLAWSGGYGVLRKTVGDVGEGAWQVKAALGIMGGGGLIAIIGGLLFVIVMLRAFHKNGWKDLLS